MSQDEEKYCQLLEIRGLLRKLLTLTDGIDYEKYVKSHIIKADIEIKRQCVLLETNSSPKSSFFSPTLMEMGD